MVDDPGGREHCYLADFGLTESASDRDPSDGSLMGTLDYIAPEQIRGDPADGRADQYALACLLFESLTGAPPFRRDTDVATIFAHLEEPPPSVADSRPDLPSELDAVLARGMAKDPADRYDTCERLMTAARGSVGIGETEKSRTPALVATVALVVLLAGALAIALATGGGEPAAAEAPGAVVRVDARTGAVDARHELGGRPAALAVGAGNVWAGSHDDAGLWRVDAWSGRVTRVESTGKPRDLAYHDGRMYVSSEGPGNFDGNIVAYDAASGSRLDGLTLLPCSLGAGRREGVWATACPEVEQIGGDASRLRIVSRLVLPVKDPLTSGNFRQCQCDITTGDGSVWVAGDPVDSRVWRIDAASARLQDEFDLPFEIGRGIAAGDGALWVAGPADDIVARVDTAKGKVTDRIRVGRAPVGLALGRRRLWVANRLGKSLSVIDTRLRKVVRTIDLGAAPAEVAVGAGGVWAAVDV